MIPPQPNRPSDRAGLASPILLIVALLLLGGAFLWWIAGRQSGSAPDASQMVVRPFGQATLAPLVERAGPAVVSIAVMQPSPAEQNPLLRDPMYRRFFGVPDEALQPQLAAGSGVIVDARRGVIITNNHVVRNATAIEVALTDRRRFRAELIGTDPQTDIAVLRIRAPGLRSLPLADTADLRVGDYVVAIGNPFGLGQSVTSGIVSALGRGLSAEGFENFIQTDAPINPGNSGGPLLNLRGEVVGINSAIFTPGVGGNIGIGFAVPANIARFVMEQILTHGEVRRGQIGVSLVDDIPSGSSASPVEGARVAQVMPGSPAAQAGLRPGDLIVAAQGRPTQTATTLRNAIGLTEIGQSIPLTVQRGGQRIEVSVAVRAGPRPAEEEPLVLTR